MHEVLDAESFPDYLGAGVVSFLAQQGCDVNRQVGYFTRQQCIAYCLIWILQIGGTWLTPLHIAVRRNLVQTVATLISLGADVNAVGKNDVMPLNIAQQQQVDDEKSQRALLITRMLEQNGAKATVRELLRGSNAAEESAATAAGSAFSFSTSGGVPFTTNSMVSVKGTAGIPNPTRTALSAAPAASMAPTMVSAAGGGGGLLRFTGGGPSPVAPTGGHGTIFTKLSSSSYEMNEAMATTEPSSDAAPNSMRSLVYSKSDDGGLMFSTSS